MKTVDGDKNWSVIEEPDVESGWWWFADVFSRS
jgi:hypothetical protein